MRFIAVAITILFLGGCDKETISSSSPSIVSIQLSPQKNSIAVGERFTISASGFNSVGVHVGTVAVTWTSMDPSIATIDAAGVVEGKNIGIATLSAVNGGLNATAIVGVFSPRFGAKNLTIAGKAFYEDRPYSEKGFTGSLVKMPIRKATANLIALDKFVTIDSVQTGEDGLYTFNNVDNAGRRGGVYVQILAKTAGDSTNPIKILDAPSSGNEMAVSGPPVDDTKGVSFALPDLVAPVSNIGGAFNILDLLLQGGEFIQRWGPCPEPNPLCKLPLLVAYWKQGNPEVTSYTTRDLFNVIYVGGGRIVGGVITGDPDEYDDTILLHEYGHFIASQFSRDDSPGGMHNPVDSAQDVRLSWSEGWATFFASAVLNSPLGLDTNVQGISLVFDIDKVASPQAFPSLSVKAITTANEISISSVLWDILDSTSSSIGPDDDPMTTIGFLPLWRTFTDMRKSDMATMESFAFPFMSQNPAETNSFRTVLMGRKIEFFPDPLSLLSTPLTLGISQHRTLYKSDLEPFPDEDIISFSVEAGRSYTVKTFNLTNGADTMITISGVSPSENDNADGGRYTVNCHNDDKDIKNKCPKNDLTTLASSITFSAGTTGDLSVRVRRSPNAPHSTGRTGSYDIRYDRN